MNGAHVPLPMAFAAGAPCPRLPDGLGQHQGSQESGRGLRRGLPGRGLTFVLRCRKLYTPPGSPPPAWPSVTSATQLRGPPGIWVSPQGSHSRESGGGREGLFCRHLPKGREWQPLQTPPWPTLAACWGEGDTVPPGPCLSLSPQPWGAEALLGLAQLILKLRSQLGPGLSLSEAEVKRVSPNFTFFNLFEFLYSPVPTWGPITKQLDRLLVNGGQ